MNHSIVWRDKNIYASFPSLVIVKDKLYCAFRVAPTKRSKTHIDTRSTALVLSSLDNGDTWQHYLEVEAPGSFAGLQDPVLSHAENELIVSFYSWKSRIGKYTKKRRNVISQGLFLRSLKDGKVGACNRISGNAAIQFVGRAPIEEVDCTKLLPVYADVGGGGTCCFVLEWDLPTQTRWTIRSRIAHDQVLDFTEPTIVDCGNRHVLCILRGSDGQLYQTHSWDSGKTWEPHRATGMFGAPASLCHLGKAGNYTTILCTYGYRRAPYGVRACLSYDSGLTWDTRREIIIRADGGGWDLGYPSTVRVGSDLLTAYYFYTKRDKTRRIELTRWKV